MTSKQRAYLKGLAMKMDAIIQLGKGGLTPENTKAVDEALAASELIKISVLSGGSEGNGTGSCRAHSFPGCTGNRQKDRIIP